MASGLTVLMATSVYLMMVIFFSELRFLHLVIGCSGNAGNVSELCCLLIGENMLKSSVILKEETCFEGDLEFDEYIVYLWI